MGCRSVNLLINMQKTVSLNYFWRRNLPNFKFNCIVLRTCLRMPMHRNWTGVLSTHFHFEMAEGCYPNIKIFSQTKEQKYTHSKFLDQKLSKRALRAIFHYSKEFRTTALGVTHLLTYGIVGLYVTPFGYFLTSSKT